jgi:hypothetical protein
VLIVEVYLESNAQDDKDSDNDKRTYICVVGPIDG